MPLFSSSSVTLLRRTQSMLTYNKSSGYRWSAIPKPPPPHYDRLYGVHSVLNTLRVAAAASKERRHQLQKLNLINQEKAQALDTQVGLKPTAARQDAESPAAKKTVTAVVAPPLHPHRAHLACLYVRDFSLETEERESLQHRTKHGKSHHNTTTAGRTSQKREKKVIPARYTAVRCITALAKSLDVPVRFVPRSELVQLCGERRNQNIVLEASSYRPHGIKRLDDIWANTKASVSASGVSTSTTAGAASGGKKGGSYPQVELVLFLEHIIDPTNIGGILRTAFFFGVDHVIMSRDCSACTAAVSRTSTGFLEHLNVHRAEVPTADFLKASRQAWETSGADDGKGLFEVVASAVVDAPRKADRQEKVDAKNNSDSDKGSAETGSSTPPGGAAELGSVVRNSPRKPNVRLLMLGNEDAGLPSELLQWCTHVAHVRSPRQLRLRTTASTAGRRGSVHGDCLEAHTSLPAATDDDGLDESLEGHDGETTSCCPSENLGTSASGAAGESPHRPLTEVEKREHSLQRLARIREKEVSLNVNTATAALLTSLMAVEGELPRHASLGMVEVRSYEN